MFSDKKNPQNMEGELLNKELMEVASLASQVRKRNLLKTLASTNRNMFSLTKSEHLVSLQPI